jgi:hypothetical protein
MPTSTVRINIAQLSSTQIKEELDQVWSTQFGEHTTTDIPLETPYTMNFLVGAQGVVILFPAATGNVIIAPTSVPLGSIWDTAIWDVAPWTSTAMKFVLNPNSPTRVVLPQPSTGKLGITADVALPAVTFYFF